MWIRGICKIIWIMFINDIFRCHHSLSSVIFEEEPLYTVSSDKEFRKHVCLLLRLCAVCAYVCWRVVLQSARALSCSAVCLLARWPAVLCVCWRVVLQCCVFAGALSCSAMCLLARCPAECWRVVLQKSRSLSCSAEYALARYLTCYMCAGALSCCVKCVLARCSAVEFVCWRVVLQWSLCAGALFCCVVCVQARCSAV